MKTDEFAELDTTEVEFDAMLAEAAEETAGGERLTLPHPKDR